jgi:hypothetical protein
VGLPAPDFEAEAVFDQEFIKVKLSDYQYVFSPLFCTLLRRKFVLNILHEASLQRGMGSLTRSRRVPLAKQFRRCRHASKASLGSETAAQQRYLSAMPGPLY